MCSESAFEHFDLEVRAGYRHHVEPHLMCAVTLRESEIGSRKASQTSLLRRRDCLVRSTIGGRTPGLDLTDDDRSPKSGNEVYLSLIAPPISFQDLGAPRSVPLDCRIFSATSERLAVSPSMVSTRADSSGSPSRHNSCSGTSSTLTSL